MVLRFHAVAAGSTTMLFALAVGLVACVDHAERRTVELARAEAAEADGEAARALSILEALLATDPRDQDVALRAATLSVRLGSWSQARSLLDAVPRDVAWNPELDREAKELRARIAIETARLVEAAALMRSLEAAPGEELFQRFVRRCGEVGPPPGELPTSWLPSVIGELARRQRIHESIDLWRSLPATHDRRTNLLEKIVRSSIESGQLAALRSLEELDARPPTPWKLLGRHALAEADGRWVRAGEIEEQFLRLHSDHAAAGGLVLQRSRRFVRSGRHREGLELAEQAAMLLPNRSEPLVEQALALRALGREEDARRRLEMALAIDPDDVAAGVLLRDEEATQPREFRLQLEASAGPGDA